MYHAGVRQTEERLGGGGGGYSLVASDGAIHNFFLGE